MRRSISDTRSSDAFQRRSSSSATRRFAGSAVSYCLAARGRVSGRLQILVQSSQDIVLLPGLFRIRFERGLYRDRLEHAQQFSPQRSIDGNAAKGNALRFRVVEAAAPALIVQDPMAARSAVGHQQLPPTALTA